MNTALIDISKLRERRGNEQVVSGEVRLGPARLGAEKIEFEKPFVFSATLTNAGEGIVIKGEAHGGAVLRCSRCLDKFTYEMKFPLGEIAVFAAEEQEVEEGFQVEGAQLDLAPVVYQNVMVNLPMRPLCRESCAGLCPKCGKNLNAEPHEHEEAPVDERLAPLKEFFQKKQGQ